MCTRYCCIIACIGSNCVNRWCIYYIPDVVLLHVLVVTVLVFYRCCIYYIPDVVLIVCNHLHKCVVALYTMIITECVTCSEHWITRVFILQEAILITMSALRPKLTRAATSSGQP